MLICLGILFIEFISATINVKQNARIVLQGHVYNVTLDGFRKLQAEGVWKYVAITRLWVLSYVTMAIIIQKMDVSNVKFK